MTSILEITDECFKYFREKLCNNKIHVFLNYSIKLMLNIDIFSHLLLYYNEVL